MNSKPYDIIAEGNFSFNEVELLYNPEYYSTQYSLREQSQIEDTWNYALEQALHNEQNLYDSKLFRLEKCYTYKSGEKQGLQLYLGNVTYKEYVALRRKAIPPDSVKPVDPIGTSVIIITQDQFIPIGRRSMHVEVNPGRFFTFGGFFDRDLDWNLKTHKPCIFHCIQREIREELNIDVPLANLSLLGIVYDNFHPHPEVCMLAYLQETRHHLEQTFCQEELSSLDFIPIKEIGDFIKQCEADITESLIGGFSLFQKHVLLM